MLATTGVWFGVINAAREICKEAHVLRRERLAGLHPGPYLASKLAGLVALVLVQSALLLGVVAAHVALPRDGVIAPVIVELYVTIVLAGVAGIALGLCLSAVASTPDKATSLIPIAIVPQVVFAGVMFPLSAPMEAIANAVSAHAAVDALSAIVDTNRLSVPRFLPLPPEPQYAHTPSVLLAAWGLLLVQAAAFCAIAWVRLRRR